MQSKFLKAERYFNKKLSRKNIILIDMMRMFHSNNNSIIVIYGSHYCFYAVGQSHIVLNLKNICMIIHVLNSEN